MEKQKFDNAIKYSNIAFQMIVVILGGVYGGQWLDEYFGFDNKVCTIILSLLSVFASIYIALKDFIRIKK